jgi:O-succinylbenzoic acid--CoA ligase
VVRIPWTAAVASARHGAVAVPFGPGDTWHASLSAAHVGGLMILVRAIALGGAACIAPAPRTWADLAGITHVSVVAAQLARLLEDAADPPASLKAVLLGGGPSAQALRDAALARGLPLFVTYGLTETCSQVATGRLAAGEPATLAGPPIAPTRIWAEADELLIDGPTLADAELRDGAAVPLARPLRTRDHGFLDAQGRVHVVGRHDAMFISGGKNIHPETIERALGEIPGVRAACVVGVPDARWGMRPVAFVDLLHAPPQPLRDALAALLERHLIPDAIFAMPPDEAAKMKPSRAALAARLAAGEPFDQR